MSGSQVAGSLLRGLWSEVQFCHCYLCDLGQVPSPSFPSFHKHLSSNFYAQALC